MTTQVRNAELVNLLKADFINCWIPIAQTALAAPAASVTFANLPQNFRILVLPYQARTDRAVTVENVLGRFNADGGANYHRVYGYLRGDNTHASGSGFNQTAFFAGAAYGTAGLANTFCPNEVQVQGYALADRYKHVAAQSTRFAAAAAASVEVGFYGGLWVKTPIEAITSIILFPEVGPNFVAGCRFALYGIL